MKKIIISIIILIVLAGGGYLIWDINIIDGSKKTESIGDETTTTKLKADSAALAKIAEYRYTEEYTNPSYNFSFKYPSGFTVSSLPNEGNEIIVVQNTAENIGMQIVISSFPSNDIDITPEYIKGQIPDLKVSESQEVLVGANRKGLAFLSDNVAFGGSSREVWFVWDGNLFQISTYAEMDDFLKDLFGTWQFKKK